MSGIDLLLSHIFAMRGLIEGRSLTPAPGPCLAVVCWAEAYPESLAPYKKVTGKEGHFHSFSGSCGYPVRWCQNSAGISFLKVLH